MLILVARTDKNTVMMFVDMLGFAALIRAHPDIDEHTLTHIDRLSRRVPYHGLAAQFINFHQIIENEFEEFAAQLFAGASPQAVTLADSAFITMPSLKDAAATAARIMRSFITAEVPVRIGIGCGSYLLLRFEAKSETRAATYTSQFLGTAVVNAQEARHSQVRGLRILLHSSASPLATVEDVDPPQLLPLSDSAGSAPVGEPQAAWAEINYSSPGDANVDDELMAALRRMKDAAGEKASHHYTATFEAFNQMRAARGRPPL